MFRKIFYVVAAILIVIWAVGFFIYALGAVIHLLLIVAILLFAFKISRNTRTKARQDIVYKTRQESVNKYPR